MLTTLFERKLKRSLSVILISTFAASTVMTANAHSQSEMLMPHRGMAYATWDRERLSSQHSDASIQKLSDIGVDHISICVTLYQEKHNSTSIMATDRTSSDKSLAHAIRKARKLGIKVMLKPHIDLIDKFDGTYWRADIGFNNEKDWEKWFTQYRKMIIHYARLAEKNGVEIFSVGTELSFTSRKTEQWRRIIREVRAVFSGELVYAANWDEFKNVEFWDDLDYVGIDAYFPLSYELDPSMEDLKKGWTKWQNEIGSWQKTVNKPVLFTELGYPSAPHAPHSPWQGMSTSNADVEIQARCYQAFFETIWDQSWFAGVYWWKWDTNIRAGGKHNRRFTPQNKPAERIIEAHYKGELKMDSRIASLK
jgi:exo-beta-1,3-glucanase (GH17 family)